MKNLYKNITLKIFLLSIFFIVVFSTISINKIFALEVAYPIYSSIDINASPTLPNYILYIFTVSTFIGFFAIFLSLIVAGIMYLLSPAIPNLQAKAKDRVYGSISGLLILVLSYLIITTINPQLSFLHLESLPPSPIPPPTQQAPGVYFYKSPGCSNNNFLFNTSKIIDFGEYKNKINSVGILQNPKTDTYYITILYNNPNFWGKCQYITTADPNNPYETCQNVDPFASSASIYKYDFKPLDNNDPFVGGVYFYRKSCFINSGSNYSTSDLADYCKKNSGGYYFISSQQILKPVTFDLNDLEFIEVPLDEQDCKKYDKNGKCCTKSDAELECDEDGRIPQTLGGENISSIIINGNYLVLFIYQGPGGTEAGPWTSCQEFPTSKDINRIGVQQIKWESIRNSGGVVPNYVIIIPIKKE